MALHFSKTFLSGPLSGITVPSKVTFPHSALALAAAERLLDNTEARDAMTGDEFLIDRRSVRLERVAA